MTLSDIFDFKDDIDEVLSKIGTHSEIFFKIYIEQLENTSANEDIWNEGYVENIKQVSSMIRDVVADDWADEIMDRLDSTDLVFPGSADSLQLLYEDEEYNSFIVSYAIEFHPMV